MGRNLGGSLAAVPEVLRAVAGSRVTTQSPVEPVSQPASETRRRVTVRVAALLEGFRVPVNEWFRGEMREYLLDHLQSGSSITRPYYDARILDQVLAEHLNGRQNHEKLLWALLNLEIWHRQYARA